jgi:hypothetical protein
MVLAEPEVCEARQLREALQFAGLFCFYVVCIYIEKHLG